jgi:hypothetical protein
MSNPRQTQPTQTEQNQLTTQITALGLRMASGQVSMLAGSISISNAVNVTSVARAGTGRATITLPTTFPQKFSATATDFFTGSVVNIAAIQNTSIPYTFEVNTKTSGGVLVDAVFMFTVIGGP